MRRITAVLVLGGILMLFAAQVFLQESEKEILFSKKRQIEKEIELTNKLLEDTRSKKSNTINELKLYRSKLIQRNRLIEQLGNEISRLDEEVLSNQKTLESLKKDLVKVKREYANLIYHAFKNRNANLNFMYLLASDDINQFYIRFKYLQQYKEYRYKQVELIKKLNLVIELKIVELVQKRREKTDLINKELAERATLINETKQTDRIVTVLSKKEEDLKKELRQKEKIAKKLEKEIEDVIMSEAKRSRFDALTPGDKIISNDFSKNMGRLPWPTEQGVITDRYGEHPHPVIKNLLVRNNGIDISTVKGSRARTIFEGEVSKIFSIKGANTTVIIRHGNFYTVYHNIVNVTVKVGEAVSLNQFLGDVYSDPESNETILHLEIWKELEKQNPEKWLSE